MKLAEQKAVFQEHHLSYETIRALVQRKGEIHINFNNYNYLRIMESLATRQQNNKEIVFGKDNSGESVDACKAIQYKHHLSSSFYAIEETGGRKEDLSGHYAGFLHHRRNQSFNQKTFDQKNKEKPQRLKKKSIPLEIGMQSNHCYSGFDPRPKQTNNLSLILDRKHQHLKKSQQARGEQNADENNLIKRVQINFPAFMALSREKLRANERNENKKLKYISETSHQWRERESKKSSQNSSLNRLAPPDQLNGQEEKIPIRKWRTEKKPSLSQMKNEHPFIKNIKPSFFLKKEGLMQKAFTQTICLGKSSLDKHAQKWAECRPWSVMKVEEGVRKPSPGKVDQK